MHSNSIQSAKLTMIKGIEEKNFYKKREIKIIQAFLLKLISASIYKQAQTTDLFIYP